MQLEKHWLEAIPYSHLRVNKNKKPSDQILALSYTLPLMTLDRGSVIAAVTFFLSALVTWLVSRYYYRRSDKKRVPTFVIQSRAILSESGLAAIPGVSLHCGNVDIGKKGVTEAKIYLWNSGALSILRNEVLDPYTITVPGRILTHSILKASRDVIEIETHAVGTSVLAVDFALLEP